MGEVHKHIYSILHLEDDKFDAEMVQESLLTENMQIEFDVVAYKNDFLEKLNSKSYSLIVCDYTLPDFNGISALEAAKKICPQTPFIMLTGTIGEESAADCIKLGADDYILKSNTTRLVASINRALKESKLVASNIEARRNLMRIEARLKGIYNTTLDAIITTDHEGIILDVNKSFQEIFGFKRLNVIGKPIVELIIPESYRKKYLQELARFMKTREPKIIGSKWEMNALNFEGKEFPIELALQEIIHGKRPEFSVFIQDISLRKEAEKKIKSINEDLEHKVEIRTKELQQTNTELSNILEKLKRTQMKLVQSEKMASIGQLTAGIAHEINNPTNFVLGGAIGLEENFNYVKKIMDKYEFIKDCKNKDANVLLDEIRQLKEEYEYNDIKKLIPLLIDDIKIGAQRIAEIVKGLQAFSRTDIDVMVDSDIHNGLDSTLNILHVKYKDTVKIKKHYDPLLPHIKCYPGQINQVFMNIINNAIDAIDKKGKIIITTKNLKENITISIKDNGKGMSEEVQRKVFDPFFTTKEVGSGTGLGLSISQGLIENHRGSIEVKSEVGKGSEFIILVPKNN